MGEVTVTLSGDEANVLRELDELLKAQRAGEITLTMDEQAILHELEENDRRLHEKFDALNASGGGGDSGGLILIIESEPEGMKPLSQMTPEEKGAELLRRQRTAELRRKVLGPLDGEDPLPEPRTPTEWRPWALAVGRFFSRNWTVFLAVIAALAIAGVVAFACGVGCEAATEWLNAPPKPASTSIRFGPVQGGANKTVHSVIPIVDAIVDGRGRVHRRAWCDGELLEDRVLPPATWSETTWNSSGLTIGSSSSSAPVTSSEAGK